MNKNSTTAKNGAQEFLSRFHGNAKGFKLPKFEMPGGCRFVLWCTSYPLLSSMPCQHTICYSSCGCGLHGPFRDVCQESVQGCLDAFATSCSASSTICGGWYGHWHTGLQHPAAQAGSCSKTVTATLSFQQHSLRPIPAGCRMPKTRPWSSDLKS